MFLKFLFLLCKFKIKLTFFPPPKKKYLLYHKASFFVKHYLEKDSYNVLYTKLDEFNIFVFLKSFFIFKDVKKLTTRYVLTYIKCVKPRILISSIDNQISLYNLKKYFDDITVISIQNGVRSFGSKGFEVDVDQNKDYLKKLNLSCDYFFIMSKKFKKVYSQFIKCKFITSGSIKSNMCEVGKVTTNDVAFISQYSPHIMKDDYNNFRKTEEILLKHTIIFCQKENIRCSIFLKEDVTNEIKYYKSILKNKLKNVDFIKAKSNSEKFKFLDKFRLILTVDSTLGYEMISRNKKTILVCARDQFLEKENDFRKVDFGFTYGEYYKDQGLFWINRYKKDREIQSKINEIYFLPNDKIINEYKKYKDALFYVDMGNTKLKKILNEKA